MGRFLWEAGCRIQPKSRGSLSTFSWLVVHTGAYPVEKHSRRRDRIRDGIQFRGKRGSIRGCSVLRVGCRSGVLNPYRTCLSSTAPTGHRGAPLWAELSWRGSSDTVFLGIAKTSRPSLGFVGFYDELGVWDRTEARLTSRCEGPRLYKTPVWALSRRETAGSIRTRQKIRTSLEAKVKWSSSLSGGKRETSGGSFIGRAVVVNGFWVAKAPSSKMGHLGDLARTEFLRA